MSKSNSERNDIRKVLIIQTSFPGDVILATAVIRKLSEYFPAITIDFVVRKGNEILLQNNPHVRTIYSWEKDKKKIRNLIKLIRKVRTTRYDVVLGLQRHLSGGLLTLFSNAEKKILFSKNPLSIFFSIKIPHKINPFSEIHEIERNQQLICHLTDNKPSLPELFPAKANYIKAKKVSGNKPYYTISPASVWFTKQLPAVKWIELIDKLPESHTVFLLGSKKDIPLCQNIKNGLKKPDKAVILAGSFSFLDSAALMKNAVMNYANDSAPTHLASAMNAPISVFFCSTVPGYGFGPLSEESKIFEIKYALYCRPCGVHGRAQCPKKHFKCAHDIEILSEQN